MRHDPIALYRHALHCQDSALVYALAHAFRADPVLAARADFELRLLPRETITAPGPRVLRAVERVRMTLNRQ